MTSSSRAIDTTIICGYHEYHTRKLNEQSNIDQIHTEVRSLCGFHLQNPHCLMVYSPENKNMIKLDQNQLDYGFNPFQCNNQITEIMKHDVEIYVIDIMDEFLEHEIQSGIYKFLSLLKYTF
jgi:uncharacterized protein (DUF1499 family)